MKKLFPVLMLLAVGTLVTIDVVAKPRCACNVRPKKKPKKPSKSVKKVCRPRR